MKQKTLCAICTFGVGALVLLASSFQGNVANLSDLEFANVLALSDDTEIPMKTCSRIKSTANCYEKLENGKKGKWVCTSITEVEDYEIPATSPEQCPHYHETECPEGTISE